MDEREKKEFQDLCEHIMAKFQSVLNRVEGTSHVLDVIGLSEGEKYMVQAFMGSTLAKVKNGEDDILTALLSTFAMGVLFGQEGRAHIGELQ